MNRFWPLLAPPGVSDQKGSQRGLPETTTSGPFWYFPPSQRGPEGAGLESPLPDPLWHIYAEIKEVMQ